jgi:HAD superfamily hydrolase (TIGR01662 family)
VDRTASPHRVITPPRALLFDYGGTLVDEVDVDMRAGNEWLFAQATERPSHITFDEVLDRARLVTTDVAGLRDRVHLETPWPTLLRLIHDGLGVRFDRAVPDLELGYWKASVRTREMPGAREALQQFHRAALPMAVVSNSSFGEHVIRYELEKYWLTEHLAFVMVSADYSVRKPNAMLFEVAAARLGVPARDIWFVGDRLDTDIAGAKAAGMIAVWLNRDGDQSPSADVDLSVSDWDAFVRCVVEAGVAR